MSKFLKTVSLCALVALIVYACMESEMEMDPMADESIEIVETPQRTERHRPLRIRDARAWLEETQPPVVLRGQQREARTRLAESDGREPVNMKLWRHAKRSQNERFSVVEIPVYSTLQSFIVRANSQPFEPRESPGISRLVIRRNIFTGHVDAFVQTFTGDSMYIAQPNFRRNLFQNRYLTRDENFSGSEVITSLEGEFLKGFFVENGRRVRRFGEPVLVRDSEQYERQSTRSTQSIQSFGRGSFPCDWELAWRYYTEVIEGGTYWCDWQEYWATEFIVVKYRHYYEVPIYCDDEDDGQCSNCHQNPCACCFTCWAYPCECPPPIQLFSVTVSRSPMTGGTVSGASSSIPHGASRTITASPNPGYVFVGWEGSLSSTSSHFTFSVTSDMSFTAHFRRLFTVTVNANPSTGGNVSGSGIFQSSTQRSVSANPNSGYEFVNWTGSLNSSSNPLQFLLTGNKNLTANFRPCRDDANNRANPVGYMRLAPANPANIRGATFGNTRTNRDGTVRAHNGIDLFGTVGTPIYAQFDGVFTGRFVTEQPNRVNRRYPPGYTGDTNDGGNRVSITSTVNGQTVVQTYMHLQAGTPVANNPATGTPWRWGDTIRAGQVIGYIGITGNANAAVPHLHLETRVNGRLVNPTQFLNATVSTTTVNITTPCD